VRVHTRVLNQDGVLVAEFKRLVLVPRREAGALGAEGEVD
jgi:acyl dehydratase